MLVSSQTAVKGGHGFEIAVRMDNLHGGDWGEKENNAHRVRKVSMGWWLLRLSSKILALLRLSVKFFQLRLRKRLKINFFCFTKLNIN